MSILAEAPEGADVLDLGAARAARAEARAAAGKGAAVIKLSVGFVEILAEIPLGVATDLQDGRIREGLAGVLVDPDDIDALMAEITVNDTEALTKLITGESLGE